MPVPCADERVALWHAATDEAELARTLGAAHRHPAGRIADLARAGRFQARLGGSERLTAADVALAARSGASGDLGTLAELLPEPIPDAALVLTAATRREIEALAARCIARDALVDRLGPAARARYRPGVRALLVGPSGTGKTLAVRLAGDAARAAALPRRSRQRHQQVYRRDGKEPGASCSRAPSTPKCVLLFDEADSLFGKRTDVREANDRFANAQTNYLLQRIESFDGIAMLTSNSRDALRLRLHAPARRGHRISAARPGRAPRPVASRISAAPTRSARAELNRVAAACDLAGGHIRNATLAAAVSGARASSRRSAMPTWRRASPPNTASSASPRRAASRSSRRDRRS